MNDDASLNSPNHRIEAMLQTLAKGDPRRELLERSLDFKSSWLTLAQRIMALDREGTFRQWGYRSLASYCATELQLNRVLVRKMLEGFQWVEEQAPEYLPPHTGDDAAMEAPRTPRPAPDVELASTLARGYRDVEAERIAPDTYQQIKEAALNGERNIAQVRREFREAVPEEMRENLPPDPLRHLRKALAEVEKALLQLGESQEHTNLVERAAEVRDAIYFLVSAQPED